MTLGILKILLPSVLAFIIGISLTPILTKYFYTYRLWKRSSRKDEVSNPNMSLAFQAIHNTDSELHTPRVGGVIIWMSVLLVSLIFLAIYYLYPTTLSAKLNFLSRNQTVLPLFSLIVAAIIGLIDDLMQIFGKGLLIVDGIPRTARVIVVTIIGIVGALWFYNKLDVSSIAVPFGDQIELGIFFIPFFVIVTLATFSSGVIDGIDGLAGGVMTTIFGAYTIIAFIQNQNDIAALCAVITGALLAFLWFNIPPARFYMGETGMLPLTITLTLIAFLTNTVLILPIIAFPLVATALSSAIQIFSKKHFGKKIFKIAPLHHHFQAIGWPSPKVTMRYWIISLMCAIIGVIIVISS